MQQDMALQLNGRRAASGTSSPTRHDSPKQSWGLNLHKRLEPMQHLYPACTGSHEGWHLAITAKNAWRYTHLTCCPSEEGAGGLKVLARGQAADGAVHVLWNSAGVDP